MSASDRVPAWGARDMKFSDIVLAVSQRFTGLAIAGAGLSLGRDLYGRAKSGFALILLLIVATAGISLPYLAGNRLTRWHPVGWIKWFFGVLILWLLLGAIGFVCLAFAVLFVYMLGDLFTGTDTPDKVAATLDAMKNGAFGAACLFAVGALSGLYQRKRRKRAFRLQEANQAFLNRIGLRQVDGAKSFTHQDAENNKLRLEGIGSDIVEFFVVGSRNRRAFINIDSQGTFINYTGVVDL